MKTTDIEHKIMQGAECRRCGLKYGGVGFPECYVGGEQVAVAHEMVVPASYILGLIEKGVMQKTTHLTLAHKDAVRISKVLPYTKIGDTVEVKTPDGIQLVIEIRANKKK